VQAATSAPRSDAPETITAAAAYIYNRNRRRRGAAQLKTVERAEGKAEAAEQAVDEFKFA
jgi:hypothetical protein